VTGITLGDRDTLLGVAKLKALHKRAKFPFLVANLLDAATGKPMFDDHIVVTVDGIKIGVFGVTMTGAERRPVDGSPMPWRVDNPIKVAREQVAALKSKGAEIVVALAHLSKATLKSLAEQVPGISAVLAGSGTRSMTHPDNESGVFICEAHSKGKFLSVLTLHVWNDRKPSDPFVDRFKREGLALEIQKLTARLSSYERLLEKKEAEAKKTPAGVIKAGRPARARTIGADYYRKQLVKMRAEKVAFEMELEDIAPADPTANYVAYQLAAVKKSLPDEPKIGKDVLAFRAKYPKLKPGIGKRPVPGTPPKRTKVKPAPKR
jgi:2',3'-cyclic-nucleotide 2'-phosphodiesterase (5'-nucleotidase family)